MTDNLSKVTAQKEELVRELQDLNATLELRVQEAAEELRMANEEMLRKETLSMVGTFAAGVAHELATPFSTIISYTQMMKSRLPDDRELKEEFEIVEGELKRCRTVLRGMLEFARAPQKEKSMIDLNEIILALLSLIKFQKEYRHIVLREHLGADIPRIRAVPGQLQQVIMNVVVNSLQAMPGGGELSVSTFLAGDETPGKRVVIRITDTGTGIPDEEVKNIFKPYYTSKKSGTGLGLAISDSIVREHRGEIKVRSIEGQGTTFEIYLPISEEEGSR
jgi:two-component system NtrC family sensor kinase